MTNNVIQQYEQAATEVRRIRDATIRMAKEKGYHVQKYGDTVEIDTTTKKE